MPHYICYTCNPGTCFLITLCFNLTILEHVLYCTLLHCAVLYCTVRRILCDLLQEYERLSEEDKKRFHADLQEFKHTMEKQNEGMTLMITLTLTIMIHICCLDMEYHVDCALCAHFIFICYYFLQESMLFRRYP